jgi:hypothetical protein
MQMPKLPGFPTDPTDWPWESPSQPAVKRPETRPVSAESVGGLYLLYSNWFFAESLSDSINSERLGCKFYLTVTYVSTRIDPGLTLRGLDCHWDRIYDRSTCICICVHNAIMWKKTGVHLFWAAVRGTPRVLEVPLNPARLVPLNPALESLETLDSPHDVDLDAMCNSNVQCATAHRSSCKRLYIGPKSYCFIDFIVCFIQFSYQYRVSYCFGVNTEESKGKSS